MSRNISLLILITFLSSVASANLAMVGKWLRSGESDQAYEYLSKEMEKTGELDPSHRYALGVLAFERRDWQKSQPIFESLSEKSVFKPWARFYLGQMARQKQEFNKAKRYLKPLTYRRQPILLKRDARYVLAQVAIDQGHLSLIHI